MPDQQPDKRCGACDRWVVIREGWCLEILERTDKDDGLTCPHWTPKPPKNPEEKP